MSRIKPHLITIAATLCASLSGCNGVLEFTPYEVDPSTSHLTAPPPGPGLCAQIQSIQNDIRGTPGSVRGSRVSTVDTSSNDRTTTAFTAQFGTASSDAAWAMDRDLDGNIYVGGVQDSNGFIEKYRSDGSLVFAQTLGPSYSGGSGSATIWGMKVSGQVLWVTGDVMGTVTHITGGSPMTTRAAFVARYSLDGTFLSSDILDSPQSEYGIDITTDPCGNAWVIGYTEGALPTRLSNSGGYEAFVANYDSSGQRVFSKHVAIGHGQGIAYSSGQDPNSAADDAIWITGHGATPGKIYARKLSLKGDLLYEGLADGANAGKIALDSTGTGWVVGELRDLTNSTRSVGVVSFNESHGSTPLQSFDIIAGTSAGDEGVAITVDSNDRVWAIGTKTGPSASYTYVASYTPATSNFEVHLNRKMTGASAKRILISPHGQLWLAGSTDAATSLTPGWPMGMGDAFLHAIEIP